MKRQPIEELALMPVCDEVRTAPLWGLGQRIFFLHDGRATPANGGLVRAIEEHRGRGSEANQVIYRFNRSHRRTSRIC